MRDFTLSIYRDLLESAIKCGYSLLSYEEYLKGGFGKFIILRHDVDRKPQNSMEIAKIQASLGVKGSYYFRSVPESFQEKYIKAIADLGHEIGYHYEDLTLSKGNVEDALALFKVHLERLRQFYPVSTMCMHGSPSTKWDNKDLWKKYSYSDYGIEAEPYFDIDFDQVYYLTDTGRMWDGRKYSVRDKVKSSFSFSVHSTQQLITEIQEGRAPEKIMQNIHPERWTSNTLEWFRNRMTQLLKNQI